MGLVIGEALSLIPSSLGGGFRGLQITPGPQGRGDPKDPALPGALAPKRKPT